VVRTFDKHIPVTTFVRWLTLKILTKHLGSDKQAVSWLGLPATYKPEEVSDIETQLMCQLGDKQVIEQLNERISSGLDYKYISTANHPMGTTVYTEERSS